MEDVVSNYKFPCIMDLKMGDKMHKDYANPEKYKRQAAKWNASTSKSLGVRIAGIQVSRLTMIVRHLCPHSTSTSITVI